MVSWWTQQPRGKVRELERAEANSLLAVSAKLKAEEDANKARGILKAGSEFHKASASCQDSREAAIKESIRNEEERGFSAVCGRQFRKL